MWKHTISLNCYQRGKWLCFLIDFALKEAGQTAHCVYVCNGLVGVIAGCLGAVVLCKLCHSSLPGPAAGPASLCCPSVTVNTQLISAPCRLERSIWSARHTCADTHKHKHMHVRMGDLTLYMQMTDLCACSHR